MNILFLGPSCHRLEHYLSALGHFVHREEIPLSPHFLESHSFDFGISYRYRHILPPEQVRYFNGRIINLHLSLLPWNRGSDPNLWSFLENTPKGVTIHQMDEGLDTGNILLQRELILKGGEQTLRTSYTALSEALEQLFLDNCEALLANAVPSRPQPSGGSCHCLRDKIPYLHLIEEKWRDTEVDSLGDAFQRERVCITLRKVQREDKAFIFRLVNDPEVRAMSFCTDYISWKTHCCWFASQIDKGYPFYIALYNTDPCGYVRLEKNIPGKWDNTDLTLTIAVSPKYRGKGIGATIITTACQLTLKNTPFRRIYAYVKQNNVRSLRVFDKSHFKRTGTTIKSGSSAVCFVYPGYEE